MQPFYKTIKAKILLITLVFSLIMGISVSVVSYFIYSKYLRNELVRSAESNLQYTADSIDSSLSGLTDFVRWCQSYSAVTSFTQSPKPGSKNRLDAWEALNSQYINLPQSSYITRLIVYAMNGQYLQIVPANYSSLCDVREIMESLDYLPECMESPSYRFPEGFTEDPFRTISPKLVLPLIRPVYHSYSSKVTGCIFLEVSADLFIDAIQSYAIHDERDTWLMFDGHTYLFREDGPEAVTPVYNAEKYDAGNLIYQDTVVYRNNGKGPDAFYVMRPMAQDSWYLVQSISASELKTRSRPFTFIVLLVFLTVTLTGIVFYLYLQRLVNRPVMLLAERMKKISDGDFSQDPSIEWKNEFGQIGRGMNAMSADISQLMEKRLASEKEKQDYEYRLLQSQINPHFLYNTLNSIKWMATVQNAPGIADMTTALSRLLKSISNSRCSIIPLSQELSLLEDYFTIQKYRYGGVISMEIRIDDQELLNCVVMRFTLQPLVENAIFHGIEPKGEAGSIIIHAWRPAADLVEITVTDNGVGMSPQKAAAILREENSHKSDFFREFGIASVHKRLQYEFGESYGLSVDSVPGKYTAMIIHLPYRPYKAGDNAVQNNGTRYIQQEDK